MYFGWEQYFTLPSLLIILNEYCIVGNILLSLVTFLWFWNSSDPDYWFDCKFFCIWLDVPFHCQAVKQFYYEASCQQEANTWLTAAQISPAAWTFSWQLLASHKVNMVYPFLFFFGALFLLSLHENGIKMKTQ